MTFNKYGATSAVALDISKSFDWVWHAGLLHKLKSYRISGQIFDPISIFLCTRRLQVVLDGKPSQEYPVNPVAPQGSILGPILFLLYVNHLPDHVICDYVMLLVSMLMILLCILYVIRQVIYDNDLNWLLNLNLIHQTLWTGAESGLLISKLGKLS